MRCSGIICFGDSNTYGFDPRSFIGDRYEEENRWCDIISRKLSCKVLNLGQNGRPVPVGRCRSLERIIEENPDFDTVLIMLGSNDILLGQEPGHIKDKMERLLLQLKSLRPLNILLLSPPGTTIPEGEKKLKEISELYESLAEELKIPFCDSHSWPLELCFDEVHMTEKANHIFAENLIEFIESI